VSKLLIEKNLQPSVDEIVFGSSDHALSYKIRSYEKAGIIKKIAPKLYTSNLNEQPEVLIKRNWYRILSHNFPAALMSHRSALKFQPSVAGEVFITYKYTKNIELPGLVVRSLKGKGPIAGDNIFIKDLYVSQEARAFLENFQSSRQRDNRSKVLPKEVLEAKLDTIIRVRGEEGLNILRDQAKSIAEELDMKREFDKLNKLISALLSTNSHKLLSSPLSKARVLGFPYDPLRIDLFNHLYEYLAPNEYPAFKDQNDSKQAYQTFHSMKVIFPIT